VVSSAFHVKRSLPADASRIGVALDDVAAQRLATLAELLGDQAVKVGLISESDAPRVYERHLLDCLRVVPLLTDDRSLMDLGTGAGLPGLVVSCVLPEVEVLLVDSRRRAGAFLELAVARLDVRAEVRIQRAEDLDVRVDVCTARAFGPLERSWEAAYPHLHPGGRLIYFAGGGADPRPVAREIERPAPPETISVEPVVASSSPLVIMSRGG
jgi:16S rRNA (guanine527-N7)-methyltransferase